MKNIIRNCLNSKKFWKSQCRQQGGGLKVVSGVGSSAGVWSFKINQVFLNNAYEIEVLNPDRQIIRVNGKYLKKYKSMLQKVKISR